MSGPVTSAVWRAVQRVATTATFRRIAPRYIHRIDGAVFRFTRGRRIASDVVLPIVMLTTTGRRSGAQRTVPIAAVPDGDDWLVVGSNFGQAHHPAWALNLAAEPRAVVQRRGRSYAVVAEPLEDAEREAVWPMLTRAWPPFDDYVEVAGEAGRHLLVFRLRRAS